MHRRKILVVAAGVGAAALVPSGAARAQGRGPREEPPPYGRALMTERERIEHRERMRDAGSEAERERLRIEHHERIRERAAARGTPLPEEPPRRGQGRGKGRGPAKGKELDSDGEQGGRRKGR